MPKGVCEPRIVECRACKGRFRTDKLGRAAWYCRTPACDERRRARPIERSRKARVGPPPLPSLPEVKDGLPPPQGEAIRIQVTGEGLMLNGEPCQVPVGFARGCSLVVVEVEGGYEIVNIERPLNLPEKTKPMAAALWKRHGNLKVRLNNLLAKIDSLRTLDAYNPEVVNKNVDKARALESELRACDDLAADLGIILPSWP